MANAGPGTNGSQFFLCFIPCKWLNDKHVVFGEVCDGLEVLDRIEEVGSKDGKTSEDVEIIDCGERE